MAPGNGSRAVGVAIYERTGPEKWERTPLPTDETLFDLSPGSPDLIVGQNGTILEREHTEAATAPNPSEDADDEDSATWESMDEFPDEDDPEDADGDAADEPDEDQADPPDEPDEDS